MVHSGKCSDAVDVMVIMDMEITDMEIMDMVEATGTAVTTMNNNWLCSTLLEGNSKARSSHYNSSDSLFDAH